MLEKVKATKVPVHFNKPRKELLQPVSNLLASLVYHGFKELTKEDKVGTHGNTLAHNSFVEPSYALINTLFLVGGNYNFVWLQQFNVVIIGSAKLGFVLQVMGLFSLLAAPALKLYGTISMSLIIALVHATCFVDETSLSPATLVYEMLAVLVSCVAGGSNAKRIFHEFIDAKDGKLIGVGAAELDLESVQHAATLTIGGIGDCYVSQTKGFFHFKQWDPGGCFRVYWKGQPEIEVTLEDEIALLEACPIYNLEDNVELNRGVMIWSQGASIGYCPICMFLSSFSFIANGVR